MKTCHPSLQISPTSPISSFTSIDDLKALKLENELLKKQLMNIRQNDPNVLIKENFICLMVGGCLLNFLEILEKLYATWNS